MNFKMKALVAAVALTASMSASAAMTVGESNDSSLVLTLLDNTNNISATFDLGYSHGTFDRQANSSWDITSGDYGSAWTTFWSTASLATTQWAVVSFDGIGAGSGEQSLFTTKANTTVTNLQNTAFDTAMGNFDKYITANNALGNHGTVANGASTATAGAAFAEESNAYGTNGTFNTRIGDTTGALDTNMLVWTVTRNGTNGLTNTIQGQYQTAAAFLPYFNMSSNGALTYTAAVAAVPEADTWAMLLAGLGVMGFIARRRTAA